MAQLSQMGFNDYDRNWRLLEANKGNVQACINQLV